MFRGSSSHRRHGAGIHLPSKSRQVCVLKSDGDEIMMFGDLNVFFVFVFSDIGLIAKSRIIEAAASLESMLR
jgi:hypothetical protein